MAPQSDWFEKDYYKVLGVDRGTPIADIRKAYRRLARENHPDARPGDAAAEERFKQISEAYSVLSDSVKREEYDRVRDMVGTGFGARGGFGGAPGGFRTGGGQAFDLNDLLGNLFGGGGRGGGGSTAGPAGRAGTGPRRGADVESEVQLDFADAMAGVEVTLRVNGQATCSLCAGSGAAPGTTPLTCATCGGRGVVNDNEGMFAFSRPCPTCGGRGAVITEPCARCDGSGVQVRTRTIRARLPAGVKDGAAVRLKGKGEAGSGGGPPGDLYVRVRVADHPLFGRRGDHVTITVPVTYGEAALGAQITVPSLDGNVTLKIPPGTPSGKTFRVKGRGASKGSDLLVSVEVVVPRKLSKTQQKLLSDYAATEDPQELRAGLGV